MLLWPTLGLVIGMLDQPLWYALPELVVLLALQAGLSIAFQRNLVYGGPSRFVVFAQNCGEPPRRVWWSFLWQNVVWGGLVALLVALAVRGARVML